MTDCNFPKIKYSYGKSYFDWGLNHGESFRDEIQELVEIRKKLMLARNAKLGPQIDQLALLQFEESKKLNPNLCQEIEGIAKGSGSSLSDIVILNNYTDFRDIELPEEGCSTIAFSGDDFGAGQTWDMHKSAKKYVNIIEIEGENGINTIIFSLVGCLGMMGINTSHCFVGVNNINTRNARASVIWPLLVRHLLEQKNADQIYQILQTKPVTSGHNYLIADQNKAYHLEVTPNLFEEVSSINDQSQGAIFHTNHCLGPQTEKIEIKDMLSSTTHNRHNILTEKTKDLKDMSQLKSLLTDHDQYPKSICSHFESGTQDPSSTCGGGIVNLKDLSCQFWRGCPTEDSNFKSYHYKFDQNHFLETKPI